MAHSKAIAKWSLYLVTGLLIIHLINLLILSDFLPIGGQFAFGKQAQFVLVVIISLIFSVSILYREYLSFSITDQIE